MPRRPLTDEEKQRISAATRLAMRRPEVQEKLRRPRPNLAAAKRGAGNAAFGTHPSEETRAKRREAMGEKHSGESNPAFKGEAAGISAIHTWLRRRYPLTGTCSQCGRDGRTERAFLRWPEPYTRNPDDYAEMCRPCHTRFDFSTGERSR